MTIACGKEGGYEAEEGDEGGFLLMVVTVQWGMEEEQSS